jgi:hypothetical protein
LSHNSSLFCCCYFGNGVFLISARITGVSYLGPTQPFHYDY